MRCPGAMTTIRLPHRGWLLDLDGTVYRGEALLPGAAARGAFAVASVAVPIGLVVYGLSHPGPRTVGSLLAAVGIAAALFSRPHRRS